MSQGGRAEKARLSSPVVPGRHCMDTDRLPTEPQLPHLEHPEGFRRQLLTQLVILEVTHW